MMKKISYLVIFVLFFTSYLKASEQGPSFRNRLKESVRSCLSSTVVGAVGFATWGFLSSFKGEETMEGAQAQAVQLLTINLMVGGGLGLSYASLVSFCKLIGFDLGLPELIHLISRYPSTKTS